MVTCDVRPRLPVQESLACQCSLSFTFAIVLRSLHPATQPLWLYHSNPGVVRCGKHGHLPLLFLDA